MDTFVYVSDAKVQMLHSQIPYAASHQLEAEVGANLGVLSAKLKTRQPDTSQASKIRLIEAYIEKNYGFGTCIEPKEWIRDDVMVKSISPVAFGGLFGLVGRSGNHYFLIGGSSRNVLGAALSGQTAGIGLSYFPYMVEALKQGFKEWEEEREVRRIWGERTDIEPERIAVGMARDEFASAVKGVVNATSGPEFGVRVVARHLATEPLVYVEGQASLFTPLYVVFK
ncbi:SAVMC3_10250 family protein [Massilia sp. NR 4-1]|uniref:DUF7019 family protein n=1 Tax=Massilia sp. NR 4-1 TaxID=1678028 RepID=UPI00067E5AB3|nr:SAVMC3_10250 family protein [Massilia sp. NR 4-1]AKU21242.1 hypothetical protein ACZ75_06865 [Massilia sp. NR 4-1]